jgi:hypothetical protein
VLEDLARKVVDRHAPIITTSPRACNRDMAAQVSDPRTTRNGTSRARSAADLNGRVWESPVTSSAEGEEHRPPLFERAFGPAPFTDVLGFASCLIGDVFDGLGFVIGPGSAIGYPWSRKRLKCKYSVLLLYVQQLVIGESGDEASMALADSPYAVPSKCYHN